MLQDGNVVSAHILWDAFCATTSTQAAAPAAQTSTYPVAPLATPDHAEAGQANAEEQALLAVLEDEQHANPPPQARFAC